MRYGVRLAGIGVVALEDEHLVAIHVREITPAVARVVVD
jgi:hypothetical protein